MAPNTNHWMSDSKYNGLLNYLIKRTENEESPMSIHQLVRDFKKKSGDAQTTDCLRFRVYKIRTVIHKIGHIDKNTKVKVLFALSAPVDDNFLKHLQKDALVKVDENKRITQYKANDGSLELNGDHRPSEKRSLLNNIFKNKNDADAVPMNDEEKEMKNFIEFITEKCENINSPLNITQLTKDFNKQFGISRSWTCIRKRVRRYCHNIQKAEFMDTPSKVKQLFGLSARLDSDYLEKLRKDAVVEVDGLNRITKYTGNDGRFTLHGDHSSSAKNIIRQLASKRSHRTLINNYFENKKDVDAVPKNKEEKEMGNFIGFITEKCDTADTPLCFTQLTKDFNSNFGISRTLVCIQKRVKSYCREVQKTEFVDNQSKVKQLFCLGATLDSDFLKELRKDAVVEVDDLNRIKKYTSNNSGLTLYGDHSHSAKNKSDWIVRRKNKRRVKKHCISGDDEDEESEKENGYSEEESDEYSSEEFDSEFDSDDDNNPLDETEDLLEASNKADEFDNETPVRNGSPIDMSIDDNFDFDFPSERSHISKESEMRENDENDDPEITGDAVVEPQRFETLPKSKNSSSTSNTPKKPKRKADESAGSSSSKQTKPLTEESINPGETNDNISHDDPPRVKLEPFRGSLMYPNGIEDDPDIQQIPKPRPQIMGAQSKTSSFTSCTPEASKGKADAPGSSTSKRTKPLPEESINPRNSNDNISHDGPSRVELNPFRGPCGLPKETQKDSAIQQIPKSPPDVIEVPIKKENGEETETSLKKVLNAFKSLILSLDTPGLTQLQMELDTKILKIGRGVEVSNKEVIMAMDFLIAKLSKHGALKASRDSISLRDILLMLRTIILNSSFNGLEVILEMLRENIEKLNFLDKKVPVSKVECVLRATLDSIST